MIEQHEYPVNRNGVGINFENLRDNKGALISASGRIIHSEISDNEIYLEDGGYSMQATLGDDFLSFYIYTKNIQTGKKHPDFFAAKFVGLAVNHFESKGLPIEKVRDVWPRWSDNYTMFMEEFENSQDKVEAAKSTWSSKVYEDLGFKLNEERIIINHYPNYPTADIIVAYFDRINLYGREDQRGA